LKEASAMDQSRNWFRGVLVFLLMLLGVNGSAIPTPSASGAMLPQSTQSSRISRYLKDLAREFSVEHLVRRKHTVPHFGEVATTISVAPINFDGCTIVWNQMQEGTAAGQLIYIETHRLEVPLATLDAKRITVEPVRAGEGDRPGVDAGDYFVVSLPTVSGNKTVNVVDQNIVFNEKRGPITNVEQRKDPGAWVRVSTEEKAEILKMQFQGAIAACATAGQ
jgi:hypothetical protein